MKKQTIENILGIFYMLIFFCICTILMFYISFLTGSSYSERFALSNPRYIATVLAKHAPASIGANSNFESCTVELRLDDKSQYHLPGVKNGIVQACVSTDDFTNSQKFRPGSKVILTKYKNLFYLNQEVDLGSFIWSSYYPLLFIALLVAFSLYVRSRLLECVSSDENVQRAR